jgi:hypothetical protein
MFGNSIWAACGEHPHNGGGQAFDLSAGTSRLELNESDGRGLPIAF